MDIKTLLIPGLIIGVLGFMFAFVLALVAKRFAVDEHLPRDGHTAWPAVPAAGRCHEDRGGHRQQRAARRDAEIIRLH